MGVGHVRHCVFNIGDVMVKAILIDPFNQTITEVEYDADGSYKQIYDFIGAQPFTSIAVTPEFDGDRLFLDDEGLYRDHQRFFSIGDYPNPLAGKGLILGQNRAGEVDEVKTSAVAISADVRFHGDISGAIKPKFEVYPL